MDTTYLTEQFLDFFHGISTSTEGMAGEHARRRAVRTHCGMGAFARDAENRAAKWHSARFVDLSPRGAGLIVPWACAVGSYLLLTPDPRAPHPMILRAEVVCARASGSAYRIGVHFIGIDMPAHSQEHVQLAVAAESVNV